MSKTEPIPLSNGRLGWGGGDTPQELGEKLMPVLVARMETEAGMGYCFLILQNYQEAI